MRRQISHCYNPKRWMLGVVFVLLAIGIAIAWPIPSGWWMALAFGVFGILVIDFRVGWTMDRSTGELREWRGLGRWRTRDRTPLAQYRYVELKRNARRSELDILIGVVEPTILLASYPTYLEARRMAERLARFLRVPLQDVAAGSMSIREPSELGESLRDRLARAGAPDWSEAPSSRVGVRREERSVVVEVPKSPLLPSLVWRWLWQGAVSLWVMLLFLGNLEGLFVDPPPHLPAVFGFVVLAAILELARRARRLRSSERIVIDSRTIAVERVGRLLRGRSEVAVDDLEQVVTSDEFETDREVTPERVGSWLSPLLGRPDEQLAALKPRSLDNGVVLVGDEAELVVGANLTRDERTWLRDLIQHAVVALPR
ncbi:MAG: hypothetical protein AAF533_16425 [Acidobacteriota bacterium]